VYEEGRYTVRIYWIELDTADRALGGGRPMQLQSPVLAVLFRVLILVIIFILSRGSSVPNPKLSMLVAKE
jgi:hypothetical protein